MPKISTAQAKKLVKNYVDNKIGKTISEDETRAVWFSRKDIEEVLNEELHGIKPDGIRFYFAAYETFDPGRVPKYVQDQNKITIVMVPTTVKRSSGGEREKHPYRANEFVYSDLLTTPGAEPGYDGKDFREANDGQICPPPPTEEMLP
jgi:hypothetical protein